MHFKVEELVLDPAGSGQTQYKIKFERQQSGKMIPSSKVKEIRHLAYARWVIFSGCALKISIFNMLNLKIFGNLRIFYM